MVLQEDIKIKQGWVYTSWTCSFSMPWKNMFFIAKAFKDIFENYEVIAGSKEAGGTAIGLTEIPNQAEMLVIRGKAKHFNSMVSITMHTGTNQIDVVFPKNIGLPIDYKGIAIGFGHFMDLMELRMYTGR